MVMQAYDFLELSRRYGCRLQMGGSDQWGNIVNGVELGRRIDGTPAVRPDHAADHHRLRPEDGQDRRRRGLAQRGPAEPPSSTGSTGATPRTRDVGRFLRLFTELPLDEIARLERLAGAEINEAKKVLANEATRLAMASRRRRTPPRRPYCSTRTRASRRPDAAFEADGLHQGLPVIQIDCAADRTTASRSSSCSSRPARRLEQRGPPPDPRRRCPPQRRPPRRRDAPRRPRRHRDGLVSSRRARSATSSCARCDAPDDERHALAIASGLTGFRSALSLARTGPPSRAGWRNGPRR